MCVCVCLLSGQLSSVVLCGGWRLEYVIPADSQQEGDKKTVQWFKEDGTRAILRHPLNQRKTGSSLRNYVSRIFSSGIVEGVRGEAWFVYDPDKRHYQALTFGTLPLICN